MTTKSRPARRASVLRASSVMQPRRSSRRRATTVVAFAMLVSALVSAGPAARATTYGEYGTVTETPNVNGTTTTQGFAAGARYQYSVKIDKDNTKAVIYRWDTQAKTRVLMTNRTDGTSTIKGLGHANGMALATINGNQYLFVVTMATSGTQVVKLRINGSSYRRVGAFELRSDGSYAQASGLSLVAVTTTQVRLFFAQGDAIYRGTVGLGQKSGNIDLSYRFTVHHGSPEGVNTPQSIFYDRKLDNLLVPSTEAKGNASAVFVYPKVTWDTVVEPPVATDPFFLVASAKFKLFEIEGLGISGGRLYFNTNRSDNRDGIHRFKGYTTP